MAEYTESTLGSFKSGWKGDNVVKNKNLILLAVLVCAVFLISTTVVRAFKTTDLVTEDVVQEVPQAIQQLNIEDSTPPYFCH